MSRVYTFTSAAEAHIAAGDLLQIKADDAMAFKLLELEVSQDLDEGDAESEMITVILERRIGTVTDGSGGTSVVGAPVNPGDVAASVGLGANSSDASGGTVEELGRWAFNILAGLDKVWLEKAQNAWSAGNGATAESLLIVRLLAAPTDSLTINVIVTIEEIG